MQKRKTRWYMRYLLSYLLLAVLLLACIGIPVIQNIYGMVENEILDRTIRTLSSIVTEFDDWCHTMNSYGREIRKTAWLSPYTLTHDRYTLLKAISELNNMVIYDDIYEKIAIVYDKKYFEEMPSVYSSGNVCSSESFFSFHYRYDQWDMQAVYADLRNTVHPVMRGPEWITVARTERKQFLTYIVPLCPNAVETVNRRGAMLFMVPADNLLKMLSKVNIADQAVLAVAKADGEIVLTNSGHFDPGDCLPDGSEEKAVPCSVDQKNYHAMTLASEDGAWKFALLLPENIVFNAMQPRLWKICAILAIGMLVAAGISLALSKLLFHPVRKLAGVAASSLENDGKFSGGEFEQIEMAMTKLSRTNTDLQSRLNSQHSIMRQHILQAMCVGCMDQKEEFLALVQKDSIFFDENHLRAIVLQFDDEERVALRMDHAMRSLTRFGLLKVLREITRDYGISSIGCENSMNGQLLAVLSGSVADEEKLREALKQVQQFAIEHFEISMTIGVSDCFSGLEKLAVEYNNAAEAVKNKFIAGSGNIFVGYNKKDTVLNEELRRQFMHLEVRLIGALKDKKYGDCIGSLNEYVHLIQKSDLLPAQARQLMMVLRASIYQQLSILGKGSRAAEWLNNHQYETLDYTRDVIAAALHEMENEQNAGQETQHSELIERCTKYMDDHLSDPAMTMYKIAEDLEVSAGYLSRCFKEQMGISPWQYFDGLRLRKACILLKDTSLRIGDILLACGYMDKTNFMRKFKKQYDMTPMEYRKVNNASARDTEEETENSAAEEENDTDDMT